MNEAAVVAEYEDLVRQAKHKNMWIYVDEYRHEFHVYNLAEKPGILMGSCTTIKELISIINDTWQDQNGNWIPREVK